MNLKKLKDTARKHEQKEQWHKAIKVYLRAIEATDAGLDAVPDLSLYNRVGDLYMKVNDPTAAVKTYERAVDLYADQGFANNAIALCGKILRVNPGRVQTYLTLAKLYARKNFVVDAKKNLLEYLERMNKGSRRDEAFREISNFADQFRGEVEIRDMLRELVHAAARGSDSAEELEKLARDLRAEGGEDAGAEARPAGPAGRSGLVFLDTSEAELPSASDLEGIDTAIPPPPEPTPTPEASPTDGLTFLDTSQTERAVPEPPADLDAIEAEEVADQPLPSLEPTAMDADYEPDAVRELDGLEVGGGMTTDERTEAIHREPGLEFETTSADTSDLDERPEPLEDLEYTEHEETLAQESAVDDLEEIELVDDLEPVATEPVARVEDDEWDAGASVEDVEPVVSVDAPLEVPPVQEAEDRAPVDLEFLEPGPALDEESEAEAIDDGYTTPSTGIPLLEPEAESVAPSEQDAEPVSVEFEADEPPDQADELAGVTAAAVAPPYGPPPEPDLDTLEDLVSQSPEDPRGRRALGEALLAAGESGRGVQELEAALAGFEEQNDWGHCADILRDLMRLEPNRIKYYQKRVELAYRSGDRYQLVDSYLELGDVLVRVGSLDKALAVYNRVLEHDPTNEFAQAAFDALRPMPPAEAEPSAAVAGATVAPPQEAPPGEGYVDLGALVLEPRRKRDTRIRVEDEEPTGDEDRDFEIMLQQFKSALNESLTEEDYQAHYDLGVAFKEMGLLDEAIAEFQKALRAPEGRLRTSEALGVSFFEKGQYAIAEAILRRAVEGVEGLDDEKIGLLYWLGRANESQGRETQALAAYERAMAVDVGFMDVNERLKRLTAGRR